MKQTYYDRVQITSDLCIIAAMLGERRPYGFYQIQQFEQGDIKIIDPFNGPPHLYANGGEVDTMNLPTQHPLAEQLMTLAMAAEEKKKKWLDSGARPCYN